MIMLHEGRQKTDLTGIWKYKIDADLNGEEAGFYQADLDLSDWKDIAVPNNWYLTEIGDYFGTIWFRTEFVPKKIKDRERVFLRFGAVDYIADVWLNDVYLGNHEGIFNSFEFDVTNLLKAGEKNVLVVKDTAERETTEYVNAKMDEDTPLSEPYRRHQAVAIEQVKGHMVDAMHRPGSMTSFRQDGNSAGIWDVVELVVRPDVFVEYAKISTRVVIKKDWLGDQQDKPDGTAMVSLDVTLNNTTKEVVTSGLDALISPSNFESDAIHTRSRKVVLSPGRTTVKFVVTVEEAKLWWTWDHGHPNLYNLKLSFLNDSVDIRFGIKECVYDEKTGELFLNGKKIFLRGMRYISSLWMSEANAEMWNDDFQKMLKMNINSIRIGSHVEKDGLYSLCDELGLLMWQVFPLHYCVSDSDDFISRASDMTRDMGMMLTNHACMGMWSVYKEPEIYFLPDKPNNYHRLCKVLKETLKQVDPVRWVHLGDYREGVMNIMLGCCNDGDVDVNDKIIPPHIVEFGNQALPCMETLKTFIPEDKLSVWPPEDWDIWEYWGLFYSNTFKFAKLPMGNSLEEFIEITQDYEANAVKDQIEFLRQRKYYPVSTMYLYYWSDACAMIGSGLLDYYRRKYKVYDYMQQVYTQVLISLEPTMHPYRLGREKVFEVGNSFTAKVWVNNDHWHKVENATIAWEVVDVAEEKVVASRKFTLDLLPDSVEIPDHIVLPLLAEYAGKAFKVNMSVVGLDGEVHSENWLDFKVV
ncbi:MAG: beta galactosidase jelly roll domain-containing protein [Lachnospiraceae bacterium]|nr:beta galactosidase jelly roll domain-containing protein [Lachnospiraceae bacterium]